MNRTQGASLAESPPVAQHVRFGLINPATRFRKLFPYIGTALVVIIAVAGYSTMKGMATSRDWLAHTYQVKSELADLQLNRALLHQYLIEGRPGPEKQAGLQSTGEAVRQSLRRANSCR